MSGTTEGNGSAKRQYWGTLRVARACQVSPATVAHWFDQGWFSGHRTPTGRRRVATEDLVAFLRAHSMPVPAELQASRPVVMLVDDDADYLHLVDRAVEQSNLDVELVEVTNGTDALVEIGRREPAVIVFDYGLPDLNADQVLEHLLTPGRRLQAEVLVVTGGLPPQAEERLQRLGVAAILYKEDGVAALLHAIARALSGEGARSPAPPPAAAGPAR